MNFQEAERKYRDLKAQHAAGKLSDADFEAAVGKLRMQDAQGRWWQIGVQTGDWYMHDGQKWNKARPPTPTPPPAPVAPPTPPSVVSAPTAKGEAKSAGESGAQKPRLASVMPARLFSAAPAGRENGRGLPPTTLIAIVAVVAVVCIVLAIGGYFLFSGALGGGTTARATSTPTRAIAGLQTPGAIPTITLARPIDTPLPPPTIVITETLVVTPTNTVAPRPPTATRRPVTPTPPGPKPTDTPNVPPGFYVTGLAIEPAKPNIGDSLQFNVTFLNTTGNLQTYTWLVKVYQCPEQCQDFKHSFGETTRKENNIVVGTVTLSSERNISIGAGRCDYIAVPHYVDQTNQQIVQFNKPGGGGLYKSFSVCH